MSKKDRPAADEPDGGRAIPFEDKLDQLRADVDLLKAQIVLNVEDRVNLDPVCIREILLARRERERIFGRDLFSDPAWDILLELFLAHLTHQRVATSQICEAAVPQTTMLRWIDRLEGLSLVAREPDPLDRRRVFVELTEVGADAMTRYFSAPRDMNFRGMRNRGL